MIQFKFVDGFEIRNKYDSDWIQGGHHYRYDWIPENEIWIEIMPDEREMPVIIFHEVCERIIMKYDHFDYDEAHNVVKALEDRIREMVFGG